MKGGATRPSFFPATRVINFVKTLEDIKSALSRHRKDMSENFRVRDMGVFGSYVRGEANEDSDVDIIVTFSAPIGLLRFLSLEEFHEDLRGLKVDLVSRDALNPRIYTLNLPPPCPKDGGHLSSPGQFCDLK